MTPMRGWALAEAIVAMVLTAALAAAALGGLTGLQRRAAGEAERVALASGLRTAAQVLHAELASVDPAAGDLIAISPDRILYRAVRGTGIGCGAAADGVVIRTASWRSLRLPSPGRDSLMFLGGDGAWDLRPLIGPPRSATCPDGAAATVLPTPVPLPLGGVTVVRVFELMELRAYMSGPDGWLGMRSVSAAEAIQPVAGPFRLAPTTFAFLDGSGSPAGSPQAVRQVRSAFIGVTRTEMAAGAGARADLGRQDTLMAVVPLRGGSPP